MLSVGYTEATALRDIPLDALPERGVCLVLGRTGSGKTTLLRALGETLPRNAAVTGLPSWRGGYLPQYPERALAGRNLAEDLCGEVRPVAAKRTELREDLRAVGLEDLPLSRPGRTLSAGQRRRLALALIRRARFDHWLLDEPDAGLDAAGLAQLARVLAARPPAGRVLIATHRFELYAPLRPWALVLKREGRPIQGPLADVLRKESVHAELQLSNRPAYRILGDLDRYRRTQPKSAGYEGGKLHYLMTLLEDRAGLR